MLSLLEGRRRLLRRKEVEEDDGWVDGGRRGRKETCMEGTVVVLSMELYSVYSRVSRGGGEEEERERRGQRAEFN